MRGAGADDLQPQPGHGHLHSAVVPHGESQKPLGAITNGGFRVDTELPGSRGKLWEGREGVIEAESSSDSRGHALNQNVGRHMPERAQRSPLGRNV